MVPHLLHSCEILTEFTIYIPWCSNSTKPSSDFSPQLQDKIWGWPGNEARVHTRSMTLLTVWGIKGPLNWGEPEMVDWPHIVWDKIWEWPGNEARGTQLINDIHCSQFGELGSTELGRMEAVSSSSEESRTSESESSTYWERKGLTLIKPVHTLERKHKH